MKGSFVIPFVGWLPRTNLLVFGSLGIPVVYNLPRILTCQSWSSRLWYAPFGAIPPFRRLYGMTCMELFFSSCPPKKKDKPCHFCFFCTVFFHHHCLFYPSSCRFPTVFLTHHSVSPPTVLFTHHCPWKHWQEMKTLNTMEVAYMYCTMSFSYHQMVKYSKTDTYGACLEQGCLEGCWTMVYICFPAFLKELRNFLLHVFLSFVPQLFVSQSFQVYRCAFFHNCSDVSLTVLFTLVSQYVFQGSWDWNFHMKGLSVKLQFKHSNFEMHWLDHLVFRL